MKYMFKYFFKQHIWQIIFFILIYKKKWCKWILLEFLELAHLRHLEDFGWNFLNFYNKMNPQHFKHFFYFLNIVDSCSSPEHCLWFIKATIDFYNLQFIYYLKCIFIMGYRDFNFKLSNLNSFKFWYLRF